MFLANLPPGKKWRSFELKAHGLREFARTRADRPLDPFKLATFANLIVVDFDEIQGLRPEVRTLLLESASENWSGGACTLPGGGKVVILNPAHGPARTRATLMEEICHVFLGHQANRLGIVGTDSRGKVTARDYCKDDEEEAYGVGAAALVPFVSLRRMVLQGRSATAIARHFQVSGELVEYRLKVTKLWRTYKNQTPF